MSGLLDTHAFLWWTMGDSRLSDTARSFIDNEANSIYVSSATAWEIAIKHQLGKLALPERPLDFVPSRIAVDGMESVPITLEHALETHNLPLLHKDPFDRILVAQSRIEQVAIVTNDPMIAQYGVEIIW